MLHIHVVFPTAKPHNRDETRTDDNTPAVSSRAGSGARDRPGEGNVTANLPIILHHIHTCVARVARTSCTQHHFFLVRFFVLFQALHQKTIVAKAWLISSFTAHLLCWKLEQLLFSSWARTGHRNRLPYPMASSLVACCQPIHSFSTGGKGSATTVERRKKSHDAT